MSKYRIEVAMVAFNTAAAAFKQIREDLEKTGQAAKKASTDTAQMGGALSRVESGIGGAISKIANLRNALIALPFAAAGVGAVKFAMEVEESDNLFAVAMADMTKRGQQFSQKLERQFGMLGSTVRKDLGVWQVMFKGMGMGEEQAYKLASNLTMLNEDMVSLYNLPHDQMWEKLRSGIVGEPEPLRQLGILVDQETVKQIALRDGLIKSGDALSAQQMVMLRYHAILAQTTAAQGDLGRTMDSTTNQERLLMNNLQRLGGVAGTTALPAVNTALHNVNRAMPGLITNAGKLASAFRDMSGDTQNRILALATVLGAAGPLVRAIRGIPAELAKIKAAIMGLQVSTLGWVGLLLAGVAAIEYIGAKSVSDEQIKRAEEEHAKLVEKIQADKEKMASATPEQYAFMDNLIKMSEEGLNRLRGRRSYVEDLFGWVGEQEGKLLALSTQEAQRAVLGIRPPKTMAEYKAMMQDAADTTLDLGRYAVIAAAEVRGLGNAAGMTAEQLKEMAQSWVEVAVRQSPATKAAATRVKALEAATAATQRAIDANSVASRAASREYQNQQEKLSQLNDELSKAKNRLQELQNVQLRGMRAMDQQDRALDKQIKSLRLQQLALYDTTALNKKGDLRGGAKKQYEAIQKEIDALERRREAVGIRKDLQYTDKIAAIKEAAEGGPKPEMEYGQAMAEAKTTYERYQKLTKAVEDQEQTMKQSQKAMDAITEAGQALNDTLKVQQDELKTAKENYDAITEALTLAYKWFYIDREQIAGMGADGQQVANQMDSVMNAMLTNVTGSINTATGEVKGGLAEMVADYKTKMDEIENDWRKRQLLMQANKIGMQVITAMIKANPAWWPAINTGSTGRQIGGGTGLSRATGGPGVPGTAYHVAEAGRPEIFIPQNYGNFLPLGGGGNTTVSIVGPMAEIAIHATPGADGGLGPKAAAQVKEIVESVMDGQVAVIKRRIPRQSIGW